MTAPIGRKAAIDRELRRTLPGVHDRGGMKGFNRYQGIGRRSYYGIWVVFHCRGRGVDERQPRLNWNETHWDLGYSLSSSQLV